MINIETKHSLIHFTFSAEINTHCDDKRGLLNPETICFCIKLHTISIPIRLLVFNVYDNVFAYTERGEQIHICVGIVLVCVRLL